jgi:hypothetical protein
MLLTAVLYASSAEFMLWDGTARNGASNCCEARDVSSAGAAAAAGGGGGAAAAAAATLSLSQAAHLQRGIALLLEVLHQVRHHRLAAVNASLSANLNPAPDMTHLQDKS